MKLNKAYRKGRLLRSGIVELCNGKTKKALSLFFRLEHLISEEYDGLKKDKQ